MQREPRKGDPGSGSGMPMFLLGLKPRNNVLKCLLEFISGSLVDRGDILNLGYAGMNSRASDD